MKTEDKRRRIAIDDEYRLLIDADSVMIERLVAIDPTRSPRFDATKDDPTPRQEWRNIEKYYATIPQALDGLKERKLRTGSAADLRELLTEAREFRAHLDALFGLEA